jgi:hypothetical protein
LQTLLPLTVVLDQPPEAEATIPEAAQVEGGLPVDLCLRDDFGLRAARLVLKPILPEAGPPVLELPGEEAYEIPLAPGQRVLAERRILPLQGLGTWLGMGFQYRVEATDNCVPAGQTGYSPWRRYEAARKGRPAPEQTALLEASRRARPRSLLRPDALSRIPDFTPDELAQLGDVGRGQPASQQLQRPATKRLEDGSQAGAGAPAGGAGGQASAGARDAAGGQGYDLPRGLPQEGSPASGSSGAGGGEAGGSAGKGGKGEPTAKSGDASASAGPGAGRGGEAGGSAGKGGKGEPTAKGGDASASAGPGAGRGGEGRQGEGQPQTPGGAAGDAQEQDAGPGGQVPSGASGPGGAQPRDGGPKTGRETGPGEPEMAPPDLQTLARMKEISLEEARLYAQKLGLAAAQTGFGVSPTEPAPVRPGPARRWELGSLRVEPDAPQRKGEPGEAPPARPAVPKPRLAEIDPSYRPLVEAYFRRMNTLSH